ncbi:MAG: hypothetical protein F6K11_13670 [Leptolyngbya sp. SIO3F4]|nr:hypothetical protein [Leptolyngbya sp. SIO3F4]
MSLLQLASIFFVLLIGFSILFFACYIGALIVWALDTWFCPRKTGVGYIEKKIYEPATTRLVQMGVVAVQQNIQEQYILRIRIEHGVGKLNVKSTFFKKHVSVGDRIRVQYFISRLFKRICIIQRQLN